MEIRHREMCPKINTDCEFCCYQDGEYYCGIGVSIKKQGQECRIKKMTKCPLGKDKK